MKGGDPAATGLSGHDGNQHETTVTVPSSITRSPSNPISRPFEGNQKAAVRLEEDIGRTGVEDVPNGMREANLLTFAFYAPWVKSSQLNASKKEANSIRQKVQSQYLNETFYLILTTPISSFIHTHLLLFVGNPFRQDFCKNKKELRKFCGGAEPRCFSLELLSTPESVT